MNKLLTRPQFCESVFARDKHKCVFCNQTDPVYAHHIIERKLFSDGGYYLDNGVTVCEEHHRACERTDISTDDVRKTAGIKTVILPSNFDTNSSYDKWGNVILADGNRLAGPLFDENSVQLVISKYLHLFIGYVET